MNPLDLIPYLGKPVFVRYTKPWLTDDEVWEAVGYFTKGTIYGLWLEFHPSEKRPTKHYLPPYLSIPYEHLIEVKFANEAI